MATLGAQVVFAKTLETLHLLADLEASDLSVLDAALGEWMTRPLGREALASVVLPSNGSLYLALLNYVPAGMILMERGQIASRIRALAVAKDFRRLGLARSLLESADDFAREAGLGWLWMLVPSTNLPATACALKCGYKRFRPQFMRRERPGLITLALGHTHVEPLNGDDARQHLARWVMMASIKGDAWCRELATADLAVWNTPTVDSGQVYRLFSGAGEVGLALVGGTRQRRRITLWLDPVIWNTDLEAHVLRNVLDTLADARPVIDLEFGSHGHLRASVERYKALGFQPVVRDRVVMARRL